MTRDQIRSRVQTNLNDSNVLYTLDDLNDSIQDGYSEVAAFTGSIFKATSIDIVGNLTYYDFGSLIPDFLAVTAMFNPVTKRWLFPTYLKQLEDIRNDWELAIGNSFLFWPVNFRFVALYPKLSTSTGTLYIFYRAHADTLSGSSTPQIPEDLQQILEDYTTGDLLEQAEEFTKSQLNLANYFKGIQELKQATRKFRLPDYSPRLA